MPQDNDFDKAKRSGKKFLADWKAGAGDETGRGRTKQSQTPKGDIGSILARKEPPMFSLSTTRRRIGATAIAFTTALGTGLALAPAAHADTVVPATGQPYNITLQMSECGVMYLGTTGTCIVSLQTWMNWAVGTNLPIDGVYGPATLAAVEEFQRDNQTAYPNLGIATDGHFGPKSRWALTQWYLDASNDGQQPPCQQSTGMYCDPGAVDPGLEAGVVGTAACVATGLAAGAAAGASEALAPYAEKIGEATDIGCETIMG